MRRLNCSLKDRKLDARTPSLWPKSQQWSNRHAGGAISHGKERGSVLPLLPVLIVVCFLLGTLSVSTASTFLAKRELYNAAAAAANDAVSGISDQAYYTKSEYIFDPINAQKLAIESVRARVGDTLRLREQDIEVTVEGDVLRVTIKADFSPVFRGFLPGGLKKTRITATALAEARTTP
jgi:Flp pilus assembly protein TadG